MKEKCSFCEGTGKLCFDGQTTKCCVCEGEGEYMQEETQRCCDHNCGCSDTEAVADKDCPGCEKIDCCDPVEINEPDIEATRE